MMKKFISLILAAVFALLLVSCAVTTDPTDTEYYSDISTDGNATQTSAEVVTTEPSAATVTSVEETTETTEYVCEHDFEYTVVTPAGMLTDGERISTCKKCGELFTEAIPATRTIKILAFGNSFSNDAFINLPYVLRDLGFETVVLGNLYIGSCSVDMHWDNIKSKDKAYTFYETNIKGVRVGHPMSAQEALAKYDWDFITIQQKGNHCGDATTFSNLSNVVNYIYKNKTNPDAKIYWHMTWSYRKGVNPERYNSDQMQMYNAIAQVTKGTVMKTPHIDGLIPCGTAIQNVRSSYVGDNLNDPDDGYHLGAGYGYYTAALTWACALLGVSPESVSWYPAGLSYMKDAAPVIKASVADALATPYSVTKSKYMVKS